MKKLTKEIMAMLASNQLKEAVAAGYSLADVREAGYSLAGAREAGYSLADAREAGYSLADALRAGYSLADAREAGYSLAGARLAGYEIPELPILIKPYTQMWSDIQAKRMNHNQGTFGPASLQPEANICGTAMCTAGGLVQMAGAAGWALREKFGFALAAWLIHEASHPGWPCQNFGAIKQEWAFAYIESMAKREEVEG